MAATLFQIVEESRARVEASKRVTPMAELARQAEAVRAEAFRFRRALEQKAATSIAVIAELKKASPSLGVIREVFPVGALAKQLQDGGAAALSVLTEEKHFQGSLGNLAAAAATGMPCLRKDFIVDEYQLLEAKIHGAAAVLLIASALPGAEFAALYKSARALGLDVLCEVHDEAELARTTAMGADIIGVNSRDLKTLRVDRSTHFRLAAQVPADVLCVAESGIRTGADIRELHAAGYRAFLIGETLMEQEEPGAALKKLIAETKAAR